MPRPPRQIDSESYYHVIARGSRRQLVFGDAADYRHYLKLLDLVKQKYKFCLYHLILMPNHIHLLLKPNQPEVANFLRVLQGRYAVYFCKKYKFPGQVWQSHPKVLQIDSDAYLLACGNYIEMNPVRAGLAARPEDWPWSSYRAYAWGEKNPLIDINPLYSAMGTSQAARQKNYRDLIGRTRRA